MAGDEMKMLVVHSYPETAAQIARVEDLVREISDCEVVPDKDLTGDYDLTGFEAVVLSGSPRLLSRGETEKGYMDFLRAANLPVLGICYGHQALAYAYGARIENRGDLLEGSFPVRVLKREPLFVGLADEFLALESHREHVVKADLAKAGFDLLAESDTCAVEAIRHRVKPLFGVQFHIERSGEVGKVVMKNFGRWVEMWQGKRKQI